ncbi:hypothetical protein G6F70_003146 [Rhizopus microsporus]|nr:hypothetical protein G6F71_008763 [Rhizopus microsporus]KAG1201421.1 hypothetical protein G6F70_003146 [Rhizopus microsporus]KAG1206517.1 hypothetical protein G6F69_008774 [Rhizopus microsporus]KAG1258686.1 hypothetical protein G6F68_008617 [Rhizopus microsporus]
MLYRIQLKALWGLVHKAPDLNLYPLAGRVTRTRDGNFELKYLYICPDQLCRQPRPMGQTHWHESSSDDSGTIIVTGNGERRPSSLPVTVNGDSSLQMTPDYCSSV